MKKTITIIIPAIAWLLLSFYLLTLPGTQLPQEDWLDKIWIDKWVHIAMFGLLVWLWCRVFVKKSKRFFLAICIACILYGIAMEFVQKYLVINRSFDIGDIVADAVGSSLGLYMSLRMFIKK
ncbi:MAG TPA: VanZ family protein [Chitinophagaceae bacterium]|nr:VanZ family protein [Chitinophagaceae bacterium]